MSLGIVKAFYMCDIDLHNLVPFFQFFSICTQMWVFCTIIILYYSIHIYHIWYVRIAYINMETNHDAGWCWLNSDVNSATFCTYYIIPVTGSGMIWQSYIR